jgi:error-prone DNA polymerase
MSTPRPYAELVCRSAFSLQEGASLPEAVVDRAVELGLTAIAITDRDAVYGIPRAHRHLAGRLQLICGALVTVEGGPGLALLARDLSGWSNLCRLLTHARCAGDAEHGAVDARQRGIEKGRARLPLPLLLDHHQGLDTVLLGDWPAKDALSVRDTFGDRVSIGVSRLRRDDDGRRLAAGRSLGAQAGIPLVATTDALMHDPSRHRLQDVLTCIRLHCTLDQAGRALEGNKERHLRGPAEMSRLFHDLPALLDRSVEVAARCSFTLADLNYRYPREVVPVGRQPIEHLRDLTLLGLNRRYPSGVPERVRLQVEHELALIHRMDFPAYFLTVYDAVRFAREQGILCQGRGSAANSAVCYALGITSVDPACSSLLFERFISEERGEPPDIDVDFEHERREEVIQYIYQKYGRHRAGMVNEVIAWRRKSAVRDVGKALGLSLDQVDALAAGIQWFDRSPVDDAGLRAAGLDPRDRRVRLAVELAAEAEGLPRHIGIHVGGFTISDGPLVDLVPVEPATMADRTVIQWDKDDLDVVGFVKVDLLSLGMLTAIRKSFGLLDQHWGRPLDLADVPGEDPLVYEMLCRADSIGVFQIESRAQMSMLPRLRPQCWYDLVIECSIVRPGPIQGGMVHPYLRRRNGEEAVTYAHAALEPILQRTLGVPIFQEQVMAMAVAVGGFTPGQADELRRAMGAWRKRGGLEVLTDKLMNGMTGLGIDAAYAEQISAQIQGFGEYGFPESHAASFARLIYVSSWLKCHYPAAFTAALINSQPMGFYAPRSLIADAQRHGVVVRPVDADYSDWDCTLEPIHAPASSAPGAPLPATGGPLGPEPASVGPAPMRPGAVHQPDNPLALRMGLRLVDGLGETAGHRLAEARGQVAFQHLGDLHRRTGLSREDLSALARADTLRAYGPARVVDEGRLVKPDPWDRRQATWAVRGLYDLPLFAGVLRQEERAPLRTPTRQDELREDYRMVGLSVADHPLSALRAHLQQQGCVRADDLWDLEPGDIVDMGGLVASRQRPGTASGMVFLSLEDETGQINVVVRSKLFERQRQIILGGNLLQVRGRLQRESNAISVLAISFQPLDQGTVVSARSRDFR